MQFTDFALLGILLASCAESAEASGAVAQSEKDVSSGKAFMVALPTEGANGSNWTLQHPDKITVISESNVALGTEPGAPGEHVFVLRADAPGDFGVQFVYGRPGSEATKKRQVLIRAH